MNFSFGVETVFKHSFNCGMLARRICLIVGELWDDCCVQDVNTGEIFKSSVEFAKKHLQNEPQEMVFFKDKISYEKWFKNKTGVLVKNTMIHVVVDEDEVSLTFDERDATVEFFEKEISKELNQKPIAVR